MTQIPYTPETCGERDDNINMLDQTEESSAISSTNMSCSARTKKLLKRRLPILEWLPNYKKSDFIGDAIAGTTVGMTVIPQSMAYAAIAGLTPEYGLYSSYIGVFLYVILGSCRQITVGPTAVMGLLTFETCGASFPSCVVLTGFYSGVFEFLMALMHLGWIVSFISEPVVVGFTGGAAMTIISSQIKSFLGLKGPKGNGFLGYWEQVIRSISTITLGDTVMGLSSLLALLTLRKLKDLHIPEDRTWLKKLLWFISVSRNAIIVIITSLIAFSWQTSLPFQITGTVVGGFPPVHPPSFNLPCNSTANPTHYRTFLETWSVLGAGPLVVALISTMQNIAISKAFGSGGKTDATQEMLALGVANMVGSFFSSMPISGSFSRSAVNEASGVRSPLGGLFTGILVLMALSFLTPSFYYIPKASLAAVIIAALIFMVEFKAVKVMWNINRMDFVSCFITFTSSILLGMEYGIVIGTGLTLTLLLMKTLKPPLNPELRTDPTTSIPYLYSKPESGITFPSVDHVRSNITKLATTYPDVNVIVINFEKWTSLDYTSVIALCALVRGIEKEGKVIIFLDCGEHWIRGFQSAGLKFEDIPHCGWSDLSDYLRVKCPRKLGLE